MPSSTAHATAFDARLRPLSTAVRMRRKHLGLTQSALADLAGCSARFVFSLERSKGTVHLSKVLDVLTVLGLGLTVEPGRAPIALVKDESTP